jgi:hypothetical protein
MRQAVVVGILALFARPAVVRSQAPETGEFAVTRGADTVALERFTREDVELRGSLVRGAGASARERVRYRAVLVDDESAPLVDLSAWRADDPDASPARQSARIIFKDDSVAVDDAGRERGVFTRVFPTQRSAVPYLNLSTAFLEQATRRAARVARDSLPVPFFNLGGGQTVSGTVRRLPPDSAMILIGTVEFRVRVDATGRILGGCVPSQDLVITRLEGP